jgi:hypothetical protein
MQPSICLAIHGFIGRPFLPRAPAFLHASAGSPAAAVLAAVLHAQAALILTTPTRIHSLISLACLLAHYFTYTIFQYGIPLTSPVFSAGFPLSPATLTGTRLFTSQPRPHPPPLGRTAHSRPTRPPCISLRPSHSTIQGQTSPPPRRARHSQTQLWTSRS